MADHYDSQRCTAKTVEAIGAALGELGGARDLFAYVEDCDGQCSHEPPADLLTDLAQAERALVSALATCTAALNSALSEEHA